MPWRRLCCCAARVDVARVGRSPRATQGEEACASGVRAMQTSRLGFNTPACPLRSSAAPLARCGAPCSTEAILQHQRVHDLQRVRVQAGPSDLAGAMIACHRFLVQHGDAKKDWHVGVATKASLEALVRAAAAPAPPAPVARALALALLAHLIGAPCALVGDASRAWPCRMPEVAPWTRSTCLMVPSSEMDGP